MEGPSLYFNSVLAATYHSGSRFLPTADSDFALLRNQLDDARSMKRELWQGLMIHALERVLMPSFDSESIEVVFDIRRSESSFAAWRDSLTALISGQYIPADETLDSAQMLIMEKVSDHIQSIRRDIDRSRTLTGKLSRVTPYGIDMGIAAVVWMLPGETFAKLLPGLASPLLKAAWMSVTSGTSSPNSVLLQLQRSSVVR